MLILSIPKAAAGNRTQDLFLTKEVLYQLSYSSATRLRFALFRKRAMGFEPTTSCLEGRNSTAELHPQSKSPGTSVPGLSRVGGEGFEPPKGQARQIYSLVQ